MMASDQYYFSSGAGLPSTPIKDAYISVSGVLGSVSPPLVGAYFSGQTLSSGALSNHTFLFPKTGCWNTVNAPIGQYHNNTVSMASSNLQTMIANANSSCSQNSVEATLLLGTNLQGKNYGNNAKGHPMASFCHEANAQAEAMQYIFLNSGYNAYCDASTPANMMLLGPPAGTTVQGNHLYNAGQSHQNYIGIPLPVSLSPSSLSPHSSLTSIADVTVPHPCPSSNFPAVETKNSNSVWKNDELIFTSSGYAALPIKLLPSTEFNPVTSDHMQHVSESGMHHATILSNPRDRQGLLQDGDCNQYQIETTCIGASTYGQSLNLSLSSRRPSSMLHHNFDSQFQPIVYCTGTPDELDEKVVGQTVNIVNREHGHPRTWTGDLVSETSFLEIPRQSNSESVVAGSFNILCSSKYLKVAQQLLDEVCSAGRATRKNGLRRQNSYAWAGPNSTDMLPASREAPVLQESSNKDYARMGAAFPINDCNESSCSMSFEERQECETKKAKLLHMLQEVDTRYRQYNGQMEVLIGSFDSAVGVGAAIPYTALALQAMSRYFRCLRDAICGQIQVFCKTLGQEDTGKYLTNRGNTSRPRYMDRQLHQQSAFQQLSMLQQHSWRPQRGLPERSVSILRAWLFEHFLHPYPKDADKMILARQTGLTRSQVSNWFINARVRLWKPMVEEMYQEEAREHGVEASVRISDEADGSFNFEGGNVEAGFKEKYCKMECSMHHPYSNTALVDVNMHTEGTSEHQNFMDGHVLSSNFLPTNIASMKQHALETMADTSNVHMLESRPKESRNKKSKVNIDEPDILLSSMHMQHDSKSDETSSNVISDTYEKFGSGLGSATEQYHFTRNGSIQPDVGCYGRYGQDNLSKYGVGAGFGSRSQGNGVSLTLGLRHCDSFPAAQQTYAHGTHNYSVECRENIDGNNKEYDTFYGAGRLNSDHVNDSISTTYQTRKHIEGHMLHDFVTS